MRPHFWIGLIPAVNAFRDIGNRATEMAQHKADTWISLQDAFKHEQGNTQRGIQQESHQRRRPVFLKRFDSWWACRMNHQRHVESLSGLINGPIFTMMD